jgi:hypothetical protein
MTNVSSAKPNAVSVSGAGRCFEKIDLVRRAEFGEADLADGSIRVTSNYGMRLQSRYSWLLRGSVDITSFHP